MLTPERELILAIYLLYGIDCVHWLKQGQAAATRCLNGTWRVWECREDSYTLLGRKPVLVNPFDPRPAYVEIRSERALSASGHSIREFIRQNLPGFGLVTLLSALGALNLLVLLPFLLLTGFLSAWWRLPVALTMVTQVGLAAEVFNQGKSWRESNRSAFWREYVSLLVNPIAALRCGDVLLHALYDLATEHPPQKSKQRK